MKSASLPTSTVPFDSLMLAKLDGLTIGILICYDVEFPEAVRALTMAGADFIAVPTALMKPYCQIANHVVPARAYENEIYVAYVNRCGVEGRLEFCGLSCIIGPDGSEVIRAGSQEALLIADIDKLKIEETRKENPVLGDRRPEIYDKLVKVFSGSQSAFAAKNLTARNFDSYFRDTTLVRVLVKFKIQA